MVQRVSPSSARRCACVPRGHSRAASVAAATVRGRPFVLCVDADCFFVQVTQLFRRSVCVWLCGCGCVWLCVAVLLCFRDGADRCCNAQVEQQRQPWLKGLPVVVRQHSDIIAVSYEARALGVKKHMLPRDVRTKFPTVRIVHTYTINSKCVRMGSTRIPASSDMSVWRVFVHQGVVPILP